MNALEKKRAECATLIAAMALVHSAEQADEQFGQISVDFLRNVLPFDGSIIFDAVSALTQREVLSFAHIPMFGM